MSKAICTSDPSDFRAKGEVGTMQVPAEAGKEKQTRPLVSGEDGTKKTILIYSPDLNFCFSLSMLFQNRYNVSTTTNLGMLETFLANYSADLVMIDAFPSTKIIQTLEGLKELKRHLPIIMLYVYNSREVGLDEAIRGHVDSIFYKPFDISVVSRRVEELLESRDEGLGAGG
jgi:DNA-binding NtrC family response regulator